MVGLSSQEIFIHDKIANREFIDLADLKPGGTFNSLNSDLDPQNYIILPGLEMARAHHKPIKDIITILTISLL